jgi:uroporphyrinogen-III synthase
MSPVSPTVALFRARDDALVTAATLAARGVRAVLAPVIAFAATGAAPPEGPFDFCVATSARAIALASPRALAAARRAPLYVVGEKTAAAARAAGIAPAAPAAAEIAALLAVLPPGRALYLAGRDRKPDLEAALGRNVATLVVYEARAREAWEESEAQAAAGARAALHYSERSAALAAQLADKAGLAAPFRRMPHVCLSRAVASPLSAFGVARAMWPRAPTEAALIDTLESVLADLAGL